MFDFKQAGLLTLGAAVRAQSGIPHNTLGSHEPVLYISDGDTVTTTTIDAHGTDQYGNLIGERPNPQTGPFYIDDAERGDTLVVRFDHLAPNRDTGFTYTPVAPNAARVGMSKVRSATSPARK